MDPKKYFPSVLFSFSLVLFVACGENEALREIQGPPLANKNYYEKLLDQVESQITQSPDNVDLRIKLAGYHQSLDWPDDAEENMASLLRLAPKESHVMVLAADYYINKGDFERSWIYAQQADKLGSVHPSLSLIQAKYHLSRRNFSEASRFIEHYYQMGGSLAEAYLVGAELALQKGDTLKTKTILENGVEANPAHVELISELTSLYFSQGEMSNTSLLLEKYQQLTGDQLTFRNQLLTTYFKLGRHDLATQLVQEWPHPDESAQFVYGQLFLDSQMPDSANYYADQMLRSDSVNTQAMLLKARYLHKRGRLSESNNYYTALLQLDADNQNALQERGIVRGKIAYLRKLQEEKESIPAFNFAPKKTDN